MANKNPVITKEFLENQRKAIGTTEQIGKKVFGVKLPLDVEEKLLAIPQRERVPFIRGLIVNAVRNNND